MKTSPSVGISSPAIILRTVVLPPPLGPSNAMSSPSFTEKLTLFTATTVPNLLVTFLSSRLTPNPPQLIWSARFRLGSREFSSFFPLQPGLNRQREQRQQSQQARHCKSRLGVIL